ncbi:MAG: hypothetical protein SWK76_13770 [Actinomycetota bacterium]|nr:hypothetical protein [Actinomycetota bacterium]
MIKDRESLNRFELGLLRKERPDYRRNLRLVEAMYDEAILLEALPPRDPLDGIEVDQRIARVVNSV